MYLPTYMFVGSLELIVKIIIAFGFVQLLIKRRILCTNARLLFC